MTRRDAFKVAAAGLLATFVKPAPRRIDLSQFCADRPFMTGSYKYDLTLPYLLGDRTFATDSKVCVMVDPVGGDIADREGLVPPFGSLQWDHATLRGWREAPRLEPIRAADSDCPRCKGYGGLGGIGRECERCQGVGRVFLSEWNTRPAACPDCQGRGLVPNGPVCPNCNGWAVGVFPSLVELDGVYYDAGLYEKVRRLGAEIVPDVRRPCVAPSRFRFDGGVGLLMPVEPGAAEDRIRWARIASVGGR